MEKWGTGKEKEEINQAYKKRNALQKEIDKGERELIKQQNKNQREILTAWKEAADYTKNNRDRIKYSKTPIIDLDSKKEKEKYRAHRHNKRNKRTVKEYTDWNYDETFENNPIKISRDHYRLIQIRKYINTARKRRAAVRNQRGMSGKIASTLGKWRARQLETSLKKLQEAAGNNDMKPIWQYQRKIRMANTNIQAIIKKMEPTAKGRKKR